MSEKKVSESQPKVNPKSTQSQPCAAAAYFQIFCNSYLKVTHAWLRYKLNNKCFMID